MDGLPRMLGERKTTLKKTQNETIGLFLWLAGGMFLAGGCPCITPGNGSNDGESVRLTPYADRLGYALEGPHDFVGSLTKQDVDDPEWHLEGDFTFPTAGYTVDEPDIRVAESYPEQVFVTITVTPPAPGSIVAQVITHVPVTADIAASNLAQFRILIVEVDG